MPTEVAETALAAESVGAPSSDPGVVGVKVELDGEAGEAPPRAGAEEGAPAHEVSTGV